MSKTVNKYRCFCTTENAYVFTWSDTTPTTCPNNSSHTIDTDSITIIDSVSSTYVNISKSYAGSQGYYLMEGKIFDMPANQADVIHDVSFPWPVCVYGMRIYTKDENKGDKFCVCISPDTIIGVIVARAVQGSTKLYVNSTVMQHIAIGFKVSLFNGIQKIDVGYVLSKNEEESSITLTTELTQDAEMGTYLMMTIEIVKNITFSDAGMYEFGYGTLNGKLLPAGTIVRVMYTNENLVAKSLNVMYEITF